MKLKTAINIVETSYGAILFVGFFGIVAAFFAFKGETFVITVIALFAIVITAFLVKLNLINFYLKRCKYPYEFLSVLEQLGLTEDLQVNWSEDLMNGPKKSQMMTQQFLSDNNLATDIGRRKINLPIAFVVASISALGLVYLFQHYSFKDKPVFFIGLIIMGVTNVYLLAKGKKQNNDTEPILRFSENGLFFNNNLYEWNKIKRWVVKGESNDSAGRMKIFYSDENNDENNFIVDINKLNIDRIDFMLLLTHFKTKYG